MGVYATAICSLLVVSQVKLLVLCTSLVHKNKLGKLEE